ncbi:hypothetical protein PHYBLDRAFT_152948 [Phycomyces blakesleeanus NRRL 1555(-)]|uniref:Homeodomain-like DNA binding domain-containing transcription factor n=1 Tax=Phycomyces blakesleeanus (strain ATCC 8743b / DSM 1359 / FGSC 10004 / NBRC 33097 / NRRL 1555) TaxID=763407 RepID=A0A162T376_PHYB8|nr:hypothetical protein PHYBLDRAFT_152948 [Phycomyces blakesleeanus NRRL 1555(-)]OAD65922.1 hypothetical protein PHYBLDRAFT_152948 [Phycomyces blakesleeanus NRRL 1555(-)]|eukprot:XP_018283962.1 hypothetical protein PHYBLDRAFT_152948 [Phycomyces blakesleeanus NRRL 1555(-)]
MSNPQLAEWAKETFDLQKAPDASTISKFLKRGDKDLIIQANIKNRKRVRKGKCSEIENASVILLAY